MYEGDRTTYDLFYTPNVPLKQTNCSENVNFSRRPEKSPPAEENLHYFGCFADGFALQYNEYLLAEGGCALFGYVRAYEPELKLRELDCYRGVYCGLCRVQGKCTGQCSRLMLSYDFAFMALMRMAITDETVTLEPRRCVAHLTRRRPVAAETPALRLTAISASILAWHKLEDDKQDERGGKYIRALLATPLAGGARRRALRRNLCDPPTSGKTDGAALDSSIALHMKRLGEPEQERPPSVDVPAQLFGELLGGLLTWGLDGGRARIAEEIALHTGRWIYILDAADDYAEDVRLDRYNPFRCLCRDAGTELSEETREEIRLSLLYESRCISDALDLLDIRDRDVEGVLRNILSEGMPRVARQTLFPEPKKRKGKR